MERYEAGRASAPSFIFLLPQGLQPLRKSKVERSLAVVVPRGAARPSAEELRAFLSSRFAKWQLPDAFVFSAEIPKTSVGKFLKTQLREQYSSWKWEEK